MDKKPKDNKAIRLANLLILQREAGSKVELARRARTNPNYLTQITTGHRAVGDDLARDLEKGMRKPLGWMDHVHGDAVTIPDPEFTNSIPLFDVQSVLELCANGTPSIAEGLASATFKSRFSQRFEELEDKVEATVLTDGVVSDHAFAMRVEGDAMQSAHGGPSFPMGARIVVDPARKPTSGAFVVARVRDDIYFRKLAIEGKRKSLVPLNPAYEKIDLPPDSTICGVVVQVIVDIDASL